MFFLVHILSFPFSNTFPSPLHCIRISITSRYIYIYIYIYIYQQTNTHYMKKLVHKFQLLAIQLCSNRCQLGRHRHVFSRAYTLLQHYGTPLHGPTCTSTEPSSFQLYFLSSPLHLHQPYNFFLTISSSYQHSVFLNKQAHF